MVNIDPNIYGYFRQRGVAVEIMRSVSVFMRYVRALVTVCVRVPCPCARVPVVCACCVRVRAVACDRGVWCVE